MVVLNPKQHPRCAFRCRRRDRPQPSTLNPQPETRNPKPETRNPKPETRNPKPETPQVLVLIPSVLDPLGPLGFNFARAGSGYGAGRLGFHAPHAYTPATEPHDLKPRTVVFTSSPTPYTLNPEPGTQQVLVSIPSVLDPDMAPDGFHALHAYTPATEPYDLWK
ncbi:hypothetical protein T484DRAFT_1959117, partial [Baffinella frigidus]